MKIKVYNARPIQKTLTILGASVLAFLCLLSYFLGGMYKSVTDSIIMFSIIGGVIIAAFITYFLIRVLADSQFVFDEESITRYKKNKMALQIEWEKVVSIGHFRILDFFTNGNEWGPGFMGIDYLDENGIEQNIQVAFSRRDAKKLKESCLNSKLKNFV